MRQTGGFEFGPTSIRSRPTSWAFSSATSMGTTPNCSPSTEIKRTSLEVISSFRRCVCFFPMSYSPIFNFFNKINFKFINFHLPYVAIKSFSN